MPASTASGRRTFLLVASFVVLAVWALSALPIYESGGQGDGFEAVPLFYASLTLLPLGAIALHGSWTGSEKGLRRARVCLLVSAVLLALVIVLNVFVEIANRHPEWNLG